MLDMNQVWVDAIRDVMIGGKEASPRGMRINEILHHTHRIDMSYPVLTLASRKANYRFMIREAEWILDGSDKLAPLVVVNKQMAKFSDDGVTLTGAYGPRFMAQIDYVVEALVKDSETRQATMTLWQPNPKPSKDIPCTVALDFKIRDGKIHCQVFMRSSDLWLGLPYDVFSFTMMASKIAYKYFLRTFLELELGTLFLTAASSHLYEEHFEKARMFLYPSWALIPDGSTIYRLLPGFSLTSDPRDALSEADVSSWGKDHV